MKSPKDMELSETFRFEALGFRALALDVFLLAGILAIGRASTSREVIAVKSGVGSGSDVRIGGGTVRAGPGQVCGRTGCVTLIGVVGPVMVADNGGAIWMPPGAEARTLGCTLGASGDGDIAAG